jgi:solute carrier family 25 (adenine nucleotide translocator) protein 4/5/6/31
MRFLFAQVVTSSSETLAYPLDTIRRRLMMESGKAAGDRMYKGTADCGAKILKTEGVTGFFKGNLSNFWRSIGSSLVLVLYDELQKWMTHHGY